MKEILLTLMNPYFYRLQSNRAKFYVGIITVVVVWALQIFNVRVRLN